MAHESDDEVQLLEPGVKDHNLIPPRSPQRRFPSTNIAAPTRSTALGSSLSSSSSSSATTRASSRKASNPTRIPQEDIPSVDSFHAREVSPPASSILLSAANRPSTSRGIRQSADDSVTVGEPKRRRIGEAGSSAIVAPPAQEGQVYSGLKNGAAIETSGNIKFGSFVQSIKNDHGQASGGKPKLRDQMRPKETLSSSAPSSPVTRSQVKAERKTISNVKNIPTADEVRRISLRRESADPSSNWTMSRVQIGNSGLKSVDMTLDKKDPENNFLSLVFHNEQKVKVCLKFHLRKVVKGFVFRNGITFSMGPDFSLLGAPDDLDYDSKDPHSPQSRIMLQFGSDTSSRNAWKKFESGFDQEMYSEEYASPEDKDALEHFLKQDYDDDLGEFEIDVKNLPPLLEDKRPSRKAAVTSPFFRKSASVSNEPVVPRQEYPPRMLFMYPFDGENAVSISTDESFRLNEGEWLNDNVIEFYLRYLVDHLDESLRKRIHIFNTFFYRRLQLRAGASGDRAKRMHDNVKNWTRKKGIDLFEKDFIFVPINESAHWYLAVICFLPVKAKEILEESETNKGRDVVDLANDEDENENDLESETGGDAEKESLTKPMTVIFDSLNGSKTHVFGNLNAYLRQEFEAFHPSVCAEGLKIKGQMAKNPLQSNGCDCGVFLLHFVEKFLDDCDSPDFRRKLYEKKLADWFSGDLDIPAKRVQIRSLFEKMEQDYKQHLQTLPTQIDSPKPGSAHESDDDIIMESPESKTFKPTKRSPSPDVVVEHLRCSPSPPPPPPEKPILAADSQEKSEQSLPSQPSLIYVSPPICETPPPEVKEVEEVEGTQETLSDLPPATVLIPQAMTIDDETQETPSM